MITLKKTKASKIFKKKDPDNILILKKDGGLFLCSVNKNEKTFSWSWDDWNPIQPKEIKEIYEVIIS